MAYRDRAEASYSKRTWREMREKAQKVGGLPMLTLVGTPTAGDSFRLSMLFADCMDLSDAEGMLAEALDEVRRRKAPAAKEGTTPAA